MKFRIVPAALFLAVISPVLASRPALAQQLTPAPPPLVDPPGGVPPPEVGLGVGQLVLGTLATTGASLALAVAGAAVGGPPLAYVGLAGGIGIGGWAICGLGRTSAWYEGECTTSVVGGYLGALVLAIPLGFVGAFYAAPNPDGGYETAAGAALGAGIGLLVGTAVGATIGWHASKRRRGVAHTGAPGSPPPLPKPPFTPDGSADLRSRPLFPLAGRTITVPLLSLQF